MAGSLRKARDLWAVRPACVIDVGAAVGKWSLCAEEVWPDAAYRLIEPLSEDCAALDKLIRERPRWKHIQAAAGAECGEVVFSVSPDLDGSAVYGPDCGFEKRTVPVTTLDSIELPEGDCLLKLDTHGYEVPIFEGAKNLLPRVSLLIVEVYGQRITAESLLFHEMCEYLEQRSFRPADMVDVMRRPFDGSFWQADFLFLRQDHPVFTDRSFH